jgi:serine/threonine protein phosphatase PrpC
MTDGELTMRTLVRTSPGLVRTLNEDRAVVRTSPPLFAVADGMGGLARGDFASGLVADRLSALDLPEEPEERIRTIGAALIEANAAIQNASRSELCGSTIVLATIVGQTVHVAWAGDSRAMRLRDGVLTPLNRDHSVVQELVDLGVVTQSAARHHPLASQITRAIGVAPSVELEWRQDEVHPGDRLLLSSDGLHGVVDGRLLAELASIPDAEQAADALMAAAADGGAPDNVTFIIVDLGEPADTGEGKAGGVR